VSPLSGRRGLAASLILALAALAAARIERGPHAPDSCRSPETLRATSLIPGASARGERREDLTPEIFQWSEGRAAHPYLTDRPLDFQIVRGWTAAALADDPLRFSRVHIEPDAQSQQELDVDGRPLPVQIVWDHTVRPARIVAYAYLYEGEPVGSPRRALLRDLPRIVGSGRRPLTLLLISGEALAPRTEEVERAALRFLADAARFAERACRPA
jgi:hypothetical protein